MKLYFLFLVIIVISCQNNSSKINIKEMRVCDTIEICNKKLDKPYYYKLEQSDFLVEVDSFFNFHNFRHDYKLLIKNLSSTTIRLKLIKEKGEELFYLPLLKESFLVDSCNCKIARGSSIPEFWGAKKQIINLKKNESTFVDAQSFYNADCNIIFIYFEYLKKDTLMYHGDYFYFKENNIRRIKSG